MSKNFKDYNLSSEILTAIEKLGFENPTLVQEQVISKILEGKDIIVQSQTGSGKTASFAIPICNIIDWEENKPQALILTPTRELAIQVKEDVFNIGRLKRIKAVSIYGKSPMRSQVRDLKQKTHVVVGTPGRIIDHLDRGTLDISMIKNLVIDEADEMLNMGFINQIEDIINLLPKNIVSTLLSATMPEVIENLCLKYLNSPDKVKIEDQNITTDRISQEKYFVDEEEKIDLLCDLTVLENPDSCIIFCNTKQTVEDVDYALYKMGYSINKIHGGMEQKDRTKIMYEFKHGEFRYLVATDVASRGIDVDNISLVINYDIPFEKENYVHRMGRTGRKDNLGKAITFVTEYQDRFLDDIEDSIGKEIPLKYKPTAKEIESNKAMFDKKMNIKPERKESKGANLNKEILKLHINAGKKTKMRPTDIVGTLCNLEGMTVADIGIISIIEVSTFVEILNNKGEKVLEQLQTTPIKGRLRNVNKANE